MKKEYFFYLIPFALIGLAVALFFTLFEKVTEEVPLPPDPRVYQQPLLAAQMFLEGKGLEVKALDNFTPSSSFPPTDAVFINISSRSAFTGAHLDRLLAWVEAGGHLVVVPNSEEDPLFFELGLHIRDDGDSDLGMLHFEGEELHYAISLGSDLRFSASDDFSGELFKTNGQAFSADVSRGDGLISVFCDAHFLKNSGIEEYDNAAMLYRIVNKVKQNPAVWMVHRESFPSMWTLIWRHGWMVVLSFLVFLAILLWQLMPRLGPTLADPSLNRRSLMEHIAATGRYFLRTKQHGLLVACTREAMMDRLRKRRPDWLALEELEQFHRLAECSGLDLATVQGCFHNGNGKPEAFLEQISAIEKIRRSL